MRRPSVSLLVCSFLLSCVSACTPEPELSVVVSLRRSVAGPVLATYTKETGAALDTKFIEPTDPVPADFDVLWSDDPEISIALAKAGRLAVLPANLLHSRPAGLFDRDGHWVATSADVRVIAYNPQRIDENDVPAHFEQLLDPRWAARVTLADPTSRSSAWHAAALFAAKGSQPTVAFYRDLKEAGARFVASERDVLENIAGEGPPIGVLDGEVAFAARELGRPIRILIPDQDAGGAVLRATTLAISGNAANASRAGELVEYLLSAPVSRRLALIASHVALLDDDAPITGTLALRDFKRVLPSQAEIAQQLSEVRRSLGDLR